MVHSRPIPSLRTTGLEPAQGVLQAPASRVAQRCSHCSRASILQVVDGLPTSTPDGSGHIPQAVVIPLRVSRSPLLSHRSGLAGDCKDHLANGKAEKAELVLYKNGGG